MICTRREFLALTVVSGLAMAARADDKTGPKFTFKTKKKDDEIKAKTEKDRGVFRITSKSGISAGEITLTEGSWPKHIVLHFAEWSRHFEGFGADNGTIKLNGRLRAGEDKSVWYHDRNGNEVQDKNKSAFTVTTERKQDDELIVVVLPPDYCAKDAKSLKLFWIDAYRR